MKTPEHIGGNRGEDKLTFCFLLRFGNQVSPLNLISARPKRSLSDACPRVIIFRCRDCLYNSIFRSLPALKMLHRMNRQDCMRSQSSSHHPFWAKLKLSSVLFCDWIYHWEFGREHPRDESTWWWRVEKIHHRAVRWILKVNAISLPVDWLGKSNTYWEHG